MALKGFIKKELNLSNIGLTHQQPSRFTSSQWPCLDGLYLFWRLLAAAYLLVWLVLSGVWDYDWHTSEYNRRKWFIYLTNWSFSLLAVSAIWRFMLVAGQCYKNMTRDSYEKEHDETEMTWYLKVSWVLYNMSTVAALVVSFAYWVFIFPGMEQPLQSLHPVDVVTHGTNTVYVLLDLYITGTPVRLWHFVHGMAYCITYLLFCLVYTLAGGTNAMDKDYIYTTFDWRGSPHLAALYGVLLTVVGPIAIWMVVYTLYFVRLTIDRRCCSSDNSQQSSEYSEETDVDIVQDGYIPHVSSTQKMMCDF